MLQAKCLISWLGLGSDCRRLSFSPSVNYGSSNYCFIVFFLIVVCRHQEMIVCNMTQFE